MKRHYCYLECEYQKLSKDDCENEPPVAKVRTVEDETREKKSPDRKCNAEERIHENITERALRQQRRSHLDKTRDVCHIAQLPDELLLHIMSHVPQRQLNTVAQVCKRWSNVAQDFTLWRTVHATGMTYTTAQLCAVLERHPRLQRLTITRRNDCNEILAQMYRTNRMLTSLSIVDSRGSKLRKNIHSKMMVQILKSYQDLNELELVDVSFRSIEFYRYLLDVMSDRLRKMRLSLNPNKHELECFLVPLNKEPSENKINHIYIPM